MPFSPPATYVSKGNTGYKAILSIGSPPVAITELKSFDVDKADTPNVELTHLLSPGATEELQPGINKTATINFSGNWIGDASQLAILTDQQAQTVFTWIITAPVQQGAKTYTLSASGFFANCKTGPFENNKALDFSGKIQATGQLTETVA